MKKKTKNKTIFIYTEKFKTVKENSTEKDLKEIFNKKYFNYIKRIENRFLENIQNYDHTL